MNDYLYCTYFRGTWSVVNARVTRSNTHTKKKKKKKIVSRKLLILIIHVEQCPIVLLDYLIFF
jgi:hypothetical protein